MPTHHNMGLGGLPPTSAAIKTPNPRIKYDESIHERYPPGDPSKKAFTYFVLTGGRFVYASLIRLLIIKFVISMLPTKDVLALSTLEVISLALNPDPLWPWSGKESPFSYGTVPTSISSWQIVLKWKGFGTHKLMRSGLRNLNGLFWLVCALI